MNLRYNSGAAVALVKGGAHEGVASAALGAAGAVCSQSFPRPASPTRGFTFTL